MVERERTRTHVPYFLKPDFPRRVRWINAALSVCIPLLMLLLEFGAEADAEDRMSSTQAANQRLAQTQLRAMISHTVCLEVGLHPELKQWTNGHCGKALVQNSFAQIVKLDSAVLDAEPDVAIIANERAINRSKFARVVGSFLLVAISLSATALPSSSSES